MPNFMEMLRLKNIFAPPPITAPGIAGGDFMPEIQAPDLFPAKPDPYGNISFGTPTIDRPAPMALPADANSEYNVMQRMKEIYTPETEATNKFNALAGQYPQREKPGLLRTIGAGLMSAASAMGPRGRVQFNPQGIQAANDYLYQPYNEKLMDWRNQIAPAQQAASLERMNNANERTLAYNTVSAELREQALRHKEKNDEVKAKIAQQRADIYDFKARNPNLKIIVPKAGTIQTFNPATGETKDTGIDVGSLTELDRINLMQENEMERIGARGANAMELEDVRQGGREALAETRGWTPFNTADGKTILVNQITGETKPIGVEGQLSKVGTPTGAGKGELPTQTRVRQLNAAKQLYNTRPELRPFIRISPDGFEIVPPPKPDSWLGRGPTPQQFKEIQDAIYGQGQPAISQPDRTRPTSNQSATNIPTPNTQYRRQRSPSTGRIRESFDGGKTWHEINNSK